MATPSHAQALDVDPLLVGINNSFSEAVSTMWVSDPCLERTGIPSDIRIGTLNIAVVEKRLRAIAKYMLEPIKK